MKFQNFATKEIKEVLEILKSRETGLTEKEANERQKIFGLNEIKEKESSLIQILFRQFKSAFFYLLIFAGILAFFLGEKINSFLILIFAFFNALIGFLQEFKAQRALLLLKKFFPPDVNILREGREKIIDKKFLVPGDVVILGPGDIIPADLRILEARNLLVDESILTGESEPVAKSFEKVERVENIFDAKNILFSGTSIVTGKAKGIVISIGGETEIGKIGKLIAQIEKPSAYEKEIKDFSRVILRFVVLTIIFIFLANLFIKKQENFVDFLIFCLALLVGIVPEALPVVVGVSLSNGALKLAKKNVLVKRLTAIEDLGNIEILCTDKTGTITENKLVLSEVFSKDEKKCLEFALLSSSLLEKDIELVTNSFDLAIFEKAKKEIQEIRKAKLISEIPFSPKRLRSSVLIQKDGKRFLILRGAPEKVLELVKNGLDKEEIIRKAKEKGKEGKRVLAIAFKEFEKNEYSEKDEKDLEFLGLLFFVDPLKKDAKATLNLAKKLGIQIKILTGDSPEVAGQIGKEVGLIEKEDEVILGKDLDLLSEKELDEICEKYSVFARVLPETKVKIIKSLQKKYEVGFVGEGINDAPALKEANVAIAVKGAAEISKEAADIILLKEDLKTIIEGIKTGRNIFSNIQKYIKATLSSNFGNMYSMAGISLIFPFLPMLPTQILLLNLLTDLPLVAVATDTLDIEELRKPKLQKFSQIFPFIFFLGIVASLFDFVFFGIFYSFGEKSIQTHWFLLSVLTEIFIILSVRTRKFFLLANPPALILIGLAIFVLIFAFSLPFTNFGQTYFHFISPSLSTILIVISISLAYLTVNEIVKHFYFRHLTKRGNHFIK